MRRILLACLFVGVAACGSAMAGTVDVAIIDRGGHRAESAVVTLTPEAAAPAPSEAPASATIDQRHEMFIPLAVVVRTGGHVTFTNNDATKHQVYSFSSIKQFQ